MRFRAGDSIALGTILATALLTGALYPRLPERVPTHFNIHGVADGWMARATGAWLLPAIALGVWLLLRLGAAVLPGAWRERLDASPTATVAALSAGLLCGLQCVILHAAIAQPPTVAVGLGLVLGGFWAALGLVLPKVRRNPWIGVRTAWTLSSDENWARTHRVAGYTFVTTGVLAVMATALGYPAAALALLVASGIVPIVYSFVLARRLPPAS